MFYVVYVSIHAEVYHLLRAFTSPSNKEYSTRPVTGTVRRIRGELVMGRLMIYFITLDNSCQLHNSAWPMVLRLEKVAR